MLSAYKVTCQPCSRARAPACMQVTDLHACAACVMPSKTSKGEISWFIVPCSNKFEKCRKEQKAFEEAFPIS